MDLQIKGKLNKQLGSIASVDKFLYHNIEPSNVKHLELSPSNQSNSGVSFNSTINNELLAPVALIKQQFKIDLSATPPLGTYLIDTNGFDAPQSCTLSKATSTMKVTVNSQDSKSVSNYGSYVSAIAKQWDNDFKNKWLSMTPTFEDNCQQFDDVSGGPNNPMAGYPNSSPLQLGRWASCKVISLVNPVGDGVNPVNGSIVFEVIEPVMVSPFKISDDSEYIPNVYQLNVEANFYAGQLFDRIWSYSGNDKGFMYTTATVLTDRANVAESKLMVFQVSVPDVLKDRVPVNYLLNTISVEQRRESNAITLASGATGTYSTAVYSLSAVPARIFIHFDDSEYNADYAKGYGSITNVVLTYGLKTLLSTASQTQIWQMSVRNGSKQKWTDFRGKSNGVYFSPDGSVHPGTQGSVIIISAAELGLTSTEAQGAQNNATLQLQITLENTSRASKTYACNVSIQYDTITNISDSVVNTSYVNVLNRSDIVNSFNNLSVAESNRVNELGGSLFDRFKKVARMADAVLSKACKAQKTVHELIPKDPKKQTGGRLLGRKEMMRRLREYDD